jgi:membrane protease YdiL (CAAX protease family)
VFVASLALGSPYSQLSFGVAILLYLAAVWRLSRAQGDVAWLAWGRMDRGILVSCVAVAVGAGLALMVWYTTARPDIGDLVERFVPPVRGPLLVIGGLLFAFLNAAVEEIAYRGAVLDALREGGVSVVGAIGVQAVAFGTLHLEGFPRGWIGVGLAALYGLLLGIIRVRAGGMLAPWITHVLTDLVIVGMLLTVA